jgi:radical SAM superfamily enzyme YgiQ (UPF0313 family)
VVRGLRAFGAMRVLCVWPAFPVTYWGCEYTLRLLGKKAALPPLGLLTVAALLPRDWEVRLCDVNVRPLEAAELAWADVVFLSGMLIQRPSLEALATRARAQGKPVVIGGPYAATSPDEVAPFADCVVVGEAEELMPELVAALEGGGALPRRMQAPVRPDVTRSPTPRFDLIDTSAYQSIGLQFSRGCPFNCEFCDIIEIFGRTPRMKTAPQLLAELDAIYATGFRGAVFFVDDNFIGNKVQTRRLLPCVAAWMRTHGDPFFLYTEASLNLATDDALVDAMVAAGFGWVFIGIETPSPAALRETQKLQNTVVDAAAGVRKLTARGLEVMAGFIVGFDADDADAIERQREWIRSAPIPLAMVGLLQALPGTQLERRLEREGRLREMSGGELFGRTNFVTRLDEAALLGGYARLLADIYAPVAYFARASLTLELCPVEPSRFRLPLRQVLAWLVRSIWQQGVRSRYRAAYWRYLARVVRRCPRRLARGVGLALLGEHMIRYTAEDVLPRLARAVDEVHREGARAHVAAVTAAGDEGDLAPTALVGAERLRPRVGQPTARTPSSGTR